MSSCLTWTTSLSFPRSHPISTTAEFGVNTCLHLLFLISTHRVALLHRREGRVSSWRTAREAIGCQLLALFAFCIVVEVSNAASGAGLRRAPEPAATKSSCTTNTRKSTMGGFRALPLSEDAYKESTTRTSKPARHDEKRHKDEDAAIFSALSRDGPAHMNLIIGRSRDVIVNAREIPLPP